MNPNGIFANNQLNMQKIKVYGFDFGSFVHSVCLFTPKVSWMIRSRLHLGTVQIHLAYIDLRQCQEKSREELPSKNVSRLVVRLRSPVLLVSRCDHELLFSTRHGCSRPSFRHQTRLVDEGRQLPQYSIGHCLSVSANVSLQPGVVFVVSGMRAVPDEEVIAAHHGTKLSIDVVGYLGNTSNMYQFVDIFSIPEITLFRDVIQVRSFSFQRCIRLAPLVFHRPQHSIRVRIRSLRRSGK